MLLALMYLVSREVQALNKMVMELLNSIYYPNAGFTAPLKALS